MREFITLVEGLFFEGSGHPRSITSDAALRMVQDIHHREDDFSDGDLSDRIYKFRRYTLETLPLDAINGEEFYTDDRSVDDYAALKTPAPPILYDAVEHSIIDGSHRVQAALKRGDKTILAYVGREQDIDPNHQPLSEGASSDFTALVKQVRDEAAKSGDLAGQCEGASGDLASMLKDLGVEAEVVFGTYDGLGHTWVETDEYVLDPTREQFGPGALIFSKSDRSYVHYEVHQRTPAESKTEDV